ncbi:hypothetical protein P344_05040 [Spiroplasma mirum ATCC 29335]|uniref:Uncharacterized protein n=1 Tax=Spiroplasma mirum ATCC 29335 TaxID=838561 RepID=W0GRH4_9MOLU|nr:MULTISPECIES: hypothetical protein [Spiroplasma]AHF61234.1 hypothetical protein SMM_0838 [Spiroplasma mirum ATCC 29335]AHI58330.1 hypothetical protein P344_05040 [Spiroplasma mirum ATCC 29335]AKM53310.1 hypothetical protein SATRI_v1c09090 [Spiroplasma atrichopogonis]
MNDEETTAIRPKICEQLTKNITTIQFNTNIAMLKIINNIWGKIKYYNFQKVPSKLKSSKEKKKMIYEINNLLIAYSKLSDAEQAQFYRSK